ncbi:amino acid permease/ SLC12A domain-containing protein [Panaeolus papilionaceus]|nr:amino acid permease/ SLC12A domain-containing protein [Panaeolus papilionaceus]
MATEKSQIVDNPTYKVESDAESARQFHTGHTDAFIAEHGKLVRQLKNRHIAMISIGGVIGTGLFLGTASSLQNGGPVGLLLGYLAVGSVCYCVMLSLGEMIAFLPIPGGHIKMAERFVDPALSFAMGWNYWYNWTIVLPAELSAASVLIGFWNDQINPAVWVIMCLVVVVTINMLGAGAYGEAEFIFASIKVITITGLIILGIVLDLGGGPNHDRLGFRFWKHPGPFVQFHGIGGAKGRFLGFWAVLSQAAFSYVGTEIVAIAAGEAKNPRRNLPKAIRRVYIRILLFYIGGTVVIGLLVPSNSDRLSLVDGQGTAAASPFVIAIERAGIKVLPSIINACLLTSAWSAASSDLYTSSRGLYGLAVAGNAPKIFLKTSKNGLPYVAVMFSSLFAFLGFMGITSGSGRVFGWFANMTSVAGLMTWFGISLTYIRFYQGMKSQGIDRRTLPFYSRIQPFAGWYAMISCLLICILSGWAVFLKDSWATDTFVTNYLPLVLFPIMYVGARFYYKERPKKAHEMDFVTNIAEIEADTVDDPPPKNKLEAFWAWLEFIICARKPLIQQSEREICMT